MNTQNDYELLREAKTAFAPFKKGVKRKAQGKIPHDYLVPSGYYEQQWDWDAFFMGIALSLENPSEAVYLKNWVLNFLSIAQEDGYTPGVVTPKGAEEGTRKILMKPLLAQGAYYASSFLNDFSWLKPHLQKIETVVLYREKHLWNSKYDLGVWFNSMESGADNNIAALDFPDKTVVATDLNSFVQQEYKAMGLIYKKLGKTDQAKHFLEKAAQIERNINQLLWNEGMNAYLNKDSRDGSPIKRVSYNCIHPLWSGIAPKERAKLFIEKYVLNPDKLWSNFGIRTLAKDDPAYNNANIIKPHSNWQGPVWPIANYFYIQALLYYGYQKEAIETAKNVAKICLEDIKMSSGMHENYDAEAGKPLAAPNFISWNLLVPSLLEQALENKPNAIL